MIYESLRQVCGTVCTKVLQLKCKELKKCRVIVIINDKFKCLWVWCRFLTLNEPFLVENRLTLRAMYDLL